MNTRLFHRLFVAAHKNLREAKQIERACVPTCRNDESARKAFEKMSANPDLVRDAEQDLKWVLDFEESAVLKRAVEIRGAIEHRQYGHLTHKELGLLTRAPRRKESALDRLAITEWVRTNLDRFNAQAEIENRKSLRHPIFLFKDFGSGFETLEALTVLSGTADGFDLGGWSTWGSAIDALFALGGVEIGMLFLNEGELRAALRNDFVKCDGEVVGLFLSQDFDGAKRFCARQNAKVSK